MVGNHGIIIIIWPFFGGSLVSPTAILGLWCFRGPSGASLSGCPRSKEWKSWTPGIYWGKHVVLAIFFWGESSIPYKLMRVWVWGDSMGFLHMGRHLWALLLLIPFTNIPWLQVETMTVQEAMARCHTLYLGQRFPDWFRDGCYGTATGLYLGRCVPRVVSCKHFPRSDDLMVSLCFFVVSNVSIEHV